MAEIVNLRRIRKAKAKAVQANTAEANRIAHGLAKPVRQLAKARAQKAEQNLAGHRLEPDK